MRRRTMFAAGTAAVVAGTAATGLAGEAAVAVPGRTAIPDVEVWTHRDRRVRFRTDLVRDHVVLLNVFFTSCGDTCPLVMQNLIGVRDLLGNRVGRDVFMYSITLQPELETPAVLKDYADSHGIGTGWELLTGSPAEIEKLRRGLGFIGPDPAADLLDDQHTGMLRYGSDALDRWSASPALLPPATIAKAIRSSMLAA